MGSGLVCSEKYLKTLYSTTVFVSSGLLLVLEMVAGRILAPYVGVSLYTWTSIIGVILGGVSLGNWVGGVAADRGWGHSKVGWLLGGSSVSGLMVLPLMVLSGGAVQQYELDLLSASFVYVLILFFLPAVFLGTITPIITTLYLAMSDQTGKVVGRMHALAALGSILGTFATGFYLVQWFGTRAIVVGVGAVLAAFAVLFFLIGKRSGPNAIGFVAVLVVVLGWMFAANGFANPCRVESNYYCLRVIDEHDGLGELYARTLVLDHMAHSTNVKDDPDVLWTPYVQIMDKLIEEHFTQAGRDMGELNYFFAGGGAYTHPRALLSRYPKAGVTVSEIDESVTQFSKAHLFFDDNDMTIHHSDTRIVMSKLEDQSYDVVVTDVFHDVGIPYHLTTLEYGQLVRQKLADDGLYLLNVIDVFPSQALVQAMVHTLKGSFPYVGVWMEKPDSEEEIRVTFVLSASNRPITDDLLVTSGYDSRVWYNVEGFIGQQIARNGEMLLTDNYAPVERLLSRLLNTSIGN